MTTPTIRKENEMRSSNRRTLSALAVSVCLTASLAFSLSGAAATDLFKLTASDGAISDRFGISVAVSGDTAVVGAPYKEGQRGAAYVFKWIDGAWIEQAKLTASDGLPSDKLGYSVSISGDTVVAGASPGAPGINPLPGAAYVFTRTNGTWTQQAKMTSPDGGPSDGFGSSVAVSGDTAVVGAHDHDVGTNLEQGSAYVFVRAEGNWVYQAKLTAADGTTNDKFGNSVAISGDSVLVGAHGDDVGTNLDNQGSAYVFKRAGGAWSQHTKLTASDGVPSDEFGFWVSISGETAVVGAVFDDVSFVDQGSAYVFSAVGGAWTQETHLIANDGAGDDAFGRSVAVSGDMVVVGAQRDDDGNVDQGSAYIFRRTEGTWPQQAKLIASDGTPSDLFGVSVAASGSTAVIGAGFHSGTAPSQGAAYVFGSPAATPVLEVAIDVEPKDKSNRIRMSSNKGIAVAVLTTPNFDATTVDPSTVCFGDNPPRGGTTSYNQPPGVDADCNESHRQGHLEDADRDGDLDMVLHFETNQTGIDPEDTEARLTGKTTHGTSFEGSDFIRTVR
jgi:hypothetical protein